MLNQVTGYLSNAGITDISHIDSDITFMLGKNKLWVATSWRLEQEATIVIGNDNLVEYLSHEDYKEDYKSKIKKNNLRHSYPGLYIVGNALPDLISIIG